MKRAWCRLGGSSGGRTACRPGGWLRPRFALDLRSLAAFRIAAGAILVADAVFRTRDFGLMFAPDGFFPLPALRQTWNADPSVWSATFLVDRGWWGGVVLALQGIAGCFLACGWGTRPATIVAWVAHLSVVRRTLPATNAGDAWLGTLLFWSMFLPLGSVWSIDAARRRTDPPAPRTASVASAAFMLQVLVVYLAAGLAKWNASWLSGEAIRRALSVHDHGTPLGTWVAGADWLMRPLTWSVVGFEILLPPLFLLASTSRIRLPIAFCFIFFHVAIQATMSVGLFAVIGMTAWQALLPGSVWPGPKQPAADAADAGKMPRFAAVPCAILASLAAVGLVHGMSPWQAQPLPGAVRVPLNACGLVQEWGMFGFVYPTEQWVYASARLADGRQVDLLRQGGPLEPDQPRGGFTSLPNNRWHKLAWLLPRPKFRPLAPHVAAALFRDWNSRHGPDAQVVTLELRAVVQGIAGDAGNRHEQLLASWPERGTGGAGNLERFLEETRREDAVRR
ncbi:MAG: HTTM domain-containing protein [Planctomycetia bacterium]